MRRMRWIGLVLALLALTLTASAQVKDKRVELSPYIGGIFLTQMGWAVDTASPSLRCSSPNTESGSWECHWRSA